MEHKIRVWLLDIDQSIDEIFEFLPKKRDFFEYKKDLKTKKAVGRILAEDRNFSIENARQIIGTRNRIIHDYDNISDEIIWTIVNRELPKLKEEVTSLLRE